MDLIKFFEMKDNFLFKDNDKFYISLNKNMNMIKFIIILSSFMTILMLVNLNNVVSFSEEFSNQTTKTNNTNFDISTLVFESGSSPFNLTYADWTVKWWQWAYSIPQTIHPSYDDSGKFCKENQKEPVWFFPGIYQKSGICYFEIPCSFRLLFSVLN